MVDESGNRPPAEALTSMGASRYRSLLVSLLLCTSLLAGFLLTLSLAVYDSSSTGWGDRESFEVRSTQYQAGIPAWFVCNKVSVTGQVPAALNLPESDKASPGFHVRWLKFAVAFVLALTLALILSLPVFLSVSRIPTRQLIKMSIAIILVVIATDFFGFFVVHDAPSSPPGYVDSNWDRFACDHRFCLFFSQLSLCDRHRNLRNLGWMVVV